MSEPRVILHALDSAHRFDYTSSSHPALVRIWTGETEVLECPASHYIFVLKGRLTVVVGELTTTLPAMHFAALPGAATLAGQANALVVSCVGYTSMALSGGPLENVGRLRYVDGCTNSVLLAPPINGEPCLNFLNLPAGTVQTAHTHPSLRVGVVASGEGYCETASGRFSMSEGTAFIIEPEALHSFQSSTDMRIVTYHPDSDCGPTHGAHSMLNKTFINGVSARDLPHLHTHSAAVA